MISDMAQEQHRRWTLFGWVRKKTKICTPLRPEHDFRHGPGTTSEGCSAGPIFGGSERRLKSARRCGQSTISDMAQEQHRRDVPRTLFLVGQNEDSFLTKQEEHLTGKTQICTPRRPKHDFLHLVSEHQQGHAPQTLFFVGQDEESL